MLCLMYTITNVVHSYAHGYSHGPQVPPATSRPQALKPVESLKGPMPYRSSSSAASMASEGDEGRHRNDPLYSRGPEPDGLYHCPFKSDPNCQHKPTKLKCNYEYVDAATSLENAKTD